MFNKFINKFSDKINKYIAQSEEILIIIFDKNAEIQAYNKLFRSTFITKNFEKRNKFTEYLLEESFDQFKNLKENIDSCGSLNFKIDDISSFSMNCRIFKEEENYMLIGNEFTIRNDDIIRKMSIMNNELSNLTRELGKKNRELEDARKKIKVLQGTLPVCSYCKKIRDSENNWLQLESYIDKHSEAQFSHTICPKCMDKYFPE